MELSSASVGTKCAATLFVYFLQKRYIALV
jgi:hypothetical protein